MTDKLENANMTDNTSDGRNEDVEFSMEAADEDDLEALARAEAADRRAADNP